MIDFDTDYPKHCVRYYGWRPASKVFKSQIKKDSLKYFTLCAKQAIDVFMLESEGLLLRDQNGKMPNVIICEKEKEDAAEIFNLVRPPLEEAIIVGKLEDILTFEDTAETRELPSGKDVKDYKIRKLLRIKDLSERVKQYFPFDIINFDPYGNLLNPVPENNKLYHSFSKIFELQRSTDAFLLFVTTPIFDIHPDSESYLKCNFESNVSSHADVRTVLQSAVGTTDYDKIDKKKRIAIGFAKSMVISVARINGWNHKHLGIFVYESPSRRKMLSSVVQFSKARTAPSESAYVEDIVGLINQMPVYYSYEKSLKNEEVKKHLKEIIKYREEIRGEYKE